MRSLAFLSLSLLTFAALAGCSEPAAEAPDGAGVADPDDHDAHGDVGANATLPFQATLAVAQNLSAGMAFNVTLDADLDDNVSANASWVLDVLDGNATSPGNATANATDEPAPVRSEEGVGLPATVSLNLTNGSYVLRLTASVPGYGDAVDEVAIEVAAATGGAPATVVQEADGEWTVGLVSCPHTQVGVFEDVTTDDLGPGDGVFWAIFEVDAGTIGGEWTLTSSSDTSVIVELDFYDTDGAYMEYHAGAPGDTLSGTVPDGAGYGVVFPCGAGPGSFSYVTA